MRCDRKEYEIKIADSPLFSLNKETQYNDYKKEALKMVEYLYCYLCAINNEKYSDLGCEIVDLANRCIKSYDISKGIFLHYFNVAWKNEYRKIQQTNFENEKYRGLHISETDKRNVRKYIKLAQSRGAVCSGQEFIANLSDAMNLPKSDMVEIIKMSGIAVESNVFQNEYGENYDIFDLMESGESAEEKAIQEENIYVIFEKIETAYNNLQDRQKRIISDVITAKICDTIEDIYISVDHFDFINIEMFEEYKKTKKVPTQRDIAEKYKRDEASISRTAKDFAKKVKMLDNRVNEDKERNIDVEIIS